MNGVNYVPVNDADFHNWAINIYEIARNNAQDQWKVEPLSVDMKTRLDYFAEKVELCSKPTRSKVDTLEKNELRKALEKDMRNYIQGMVAHNIHVTNVDRELMGLPIYDTIPTPVGEPLGVSSADITYLGGQVVELHFRHVEGTPFDKKADYGRKVYWGLYADTDHHPENGDALPKNVFTRRKKEIFKFSPSDVKKTAYFCIRYENSKGAPGPWGPMIMAVIP